MIRCARGVALVAIASHIVFLSAHAFASASVSDGVSHFDGAGWLQLAQSTGTGGAGNGAGGGTGGGASTGHGAGGPAPPGYGGASNTASDASGACGAPLQLPDPADYAKLIDGVAEISRQTQQYIEKCGCASQSCVADALDQYADALAKAAAASPASPAERLLPRALRDLPRIVRSAAAKARAAKSPKAAARVVEAAVVAVRRSVAKTISLMRASDPDAKREATRGGALVADTLRSASEQLARADSL